jgi:mRNA interferase MazF
MIRRGDIVLIPFPFSELTDVKVRPAMVICTTKDKYKDLVLAAISSQFESTLTTNEMFLAPDASNKLRKKSILKVDRIFTLKKENSIARLGKLSVTDFKLFKHKFVALVTNPL